jgi:hypothetical protein
VRLSGDGSRKDAGSLLNRCEPGEVRLKVSDKALDLRCGQLGGVGDDDLD